MNPKLLEWASANTRLNADEIIREISVDDLNGEGWSFFLPIGFLPLWPSLPVEARIIAFVQTHELQDSYDPDGNLN